MQDLAAGHAEDCNVEDEDRFSQGRRHIHHAIMYGLMLCFVSTSVATVMHYGFGLHAPYGFRSLPKLFGVYDGALLTADCGAMALLKQKSDPDLGDPSAWGVISDSSCCLGVWG